MRNFHSTFREEAKDYFFIMLGLIVYSVGFTCFILPYQITTGGVSGISAAIFYSTGFPVQWSYLLINVGLLALAIKALGLRFFAKTIVAILGITFLIGFMQELITDANGNLPRVVGDEAFMACVIGGCLEGTGLAIVFLNNGSTGGTDIIAAVVNKYRDVTLGRMMMFMDFIIVSSSYLVFQDWEKLVISFATLFISMTVLDYVMNSTRHSVQFLIFSKKYDQIAQAVSEELDRGVTVLYGEGWYSKEERRVLVIVATRAESNYIFRLINRIDPQAFVSQSRVIGVYGEGFDRIKVK